LLLASVTLKAQGAGEIVNYINTYKELAIAEMQRTGVPAAIKLAQGIHETQAGTSDLVKRSNNHFGIKCKITWTGDKVYHDDDARGECFRSYDKVEDSYRDHSDFLRSSPRYASLFQLDPTDYKAWAYGLKKAGYATNYRYPQILIKLIDDYNLEQYTLIAMGKLKPSQEVLAEGIIGTSSTVMQAVNPGKDDSGTAIIPAVKPTRVSPDYPQGEFLINRTRVVFAKAGTALLAVAEQYHIAFARLLDFNDLDDGDVLKNDQLLFLQRKRKTGDKAVHITEAGETLYDICQLEGIRLESLLAFNRLREDNQPAAGEKLWLRQEAPAQPLAAGENKMVVLAPPVAPLQFTTHIVQTKETLYSISRQYGVSQEQLKEWNKLDTFDLKAGQQLVIYKN
jgi:LysM repeat protein